MLSRLRSLLAARPLMTNCLTYGGLYTGSEFLQQTIVARQDTQYGQVAYISSKMST